MVTDYGANQQCRHAENENNQLFMNFCSKTDFDGKVNDYLIEDIKTVSNFS
jgi:hypothetical protein